MDVSLRLIVPWLLLLTGCVQEHYLVRVDRTPLYASPQGGEVLSRIPRLHHGPLELSEAERAGPRWPLSYAGQAGWVDPAALWVVEHLHPLVDGGDDREAVVQGALRELQLAELGEGWPPEVVAAIREQRVLTGMSKRQVELAWGWPETVEPGARDGEERWVYRSEQIEPMRTYMDDPWIYAGWSSFPSTGLGFYPCDRFAGGTVIIDRVVHVTRVVTLRAGRVVALRVRRRG